MAAVNEEKNVSSGFIRCKILLTLGSPGNFLKEQANLGIKPQIPCVYYDTKHEDFCK